MTRVSYSASEASSTKILIPSAANISTFSSSLVIMNVGFSTAQVALKAHGTSGEVLGQTAASLTIAANGVLTFENVLQTLGVVDNYGPIEITSLNDVPLIASSRVSSINRAGGFFEGLRYSEASTVQTVAHVVDNGEVRTNLGINNVTDFPAAVMIRLFDRNGAQLAAVPVAVAAKGLTQINNVVREMLGRQDVTNIRLRPAESNQPIFGWASEIDNSSNEQGTRSHPPAGPVNSKRGQFQVQSRGRQRWNYGSSRRHCFQRCERRCEGRIARHRDSRGRLV